MQKFVSIAAAFIIATLAFATSASAGRWHYDTNGHLTHHNHYQPPAVYPRASRPNYHNPNAAIADLFKLGLGFAAGTVAGKGQANQDFISLCHSVGKTAVRDLASNKVVCVDR